MSFTCKILCMTWETWSKNCFDFSFKRPVIFRKNCVWILWSKSANGIFGCVLYWELLRLDFRIESGCGDVHGFQWCQDRHWQWLHHSSVWRLVFVFVALMLSFIYWVFMQCVDCFLSFHCNIVFLGGNSCIIKWNVVTNAVVRLRVTYWGLNQCVFFRSLPIRCP